MTLPNTDLGVDLSLTTHGELECINPRDNNVATGLYYTPEHGCVVQHPAPVCELHYHELREFFDYSAKIASGYTCGDCHQYVQGHGWVTRL